MGVRRVAGLVLVLCLSVAGCSATIDEKPAPPAPERDVELLWQADNPIELSPTGYSKLRPLELIKPTLVRSGKTEAIEALSLAATFLAVPAEVPVYEAGNYPSDYGERFTHPLPWDFGPKGSLVWYDERKGGPLELGEGAPAEAVRELLQEKGLLMADSQTPTITTHADGGTTIRFYRHLNDLVVYGNRPACVGLDHSGQLIYFVMRRRPLVHRSSYPLRTPAEAWQALQAGEWYDVGSSICQDGGTDLPAKIEQFHVTKVELAYWEPHSDREIQVMIPYYLFRNDQGQTLYVPAVKPEWIDQEWIDANQQ